LPPKSDASRASGQILDMLGMGDMVSKTCMDGRWPIICVLTRICTAGMLPTDESLTHCPMSPSERGMEAPDGRP